MAVLSQVLGQSNPMLKQIVQIAGGKSDKQLESIAKNMCKQCGVSPEDMMKSIGFR